MSIKKAGQGIQMPIQPSIQPLTDQAKSQALPSEPKLDNARQNAFETFSTKQASQQAPATSTPLEGGGKVMSVFQQAISQLQEVSSTNALDGIAKMSQTEIRTIDSQKGQLLDHMQGLATGRPEAFSESLQQIFGSKLDADTLGELVKQTQSGDFPLPAQIKFVDSDVLRGADAAYSPKDGGMVLINRSLKDRPARLQVALTEEIGHHLDKVIGGADSIGDEGELFQRAVAKGGPLTGLELRAGKLDSDQGTITLENGQSLDVEFRSDKTARYYEAQGSFNRVDLRAAGRVDLADQVHDTLIQKFNANGASISDVKELKAYLRGEGLSIVTERVKTENAIFQEMTGTTQEPDAIEKKLVHKFRRKSLNGQPIKTADDVKAYCEANGRSFERETAYAERKLWFKTRNSFTESKGLEVGHKAQAATLIAKLKKGKVLGETANLDTKLPFDALQRVERDPVLSAQDPVIETYGELFTALTTDVDNDGKSDFDSLQLGRFLPQSSQQEILKALDHPIANEDLKDMLRGAGFEHRLLDRISARGTLSVEPPKAFGLVGRSTIERTQQQLLLRTGKVFIDSNEDGKLSDSDAVQYVDDAGSIRETTYGELNTDLKKMVKYNIATAKACEDYAALPSWNRMDFPHYDSRTGESEPERANTDFWEVSTADANRGQASWELKGDVKPSDAISDVFGGNGGKYTTECAQGRSMLRLKGLNNYYESEFGKGEGSFRFNALFAKGRSDKSQASEYIKEFELFQKDNPDKNWDDFSQANPGPELKFSLEVSRHTILGDNETISQPWERTNTESAAGDTGYFHNYSVSVEGVKIGYVGENVIDLGFKDGKRQYWGHPGGIQTEDKWSEELGSSRIAIKKMSEFGDYFSSLDITRGSARVTKERVSSLEDTISDLKNDKPAGWEDSVKQNEETIGWWKALDVARHSVATSIDPAKAKEAQAFFDNAGLSNRPESFNGLLETMTPAGINNLSDGFDHLGESSKDSIIDYFSKSDVNELTTEEKASAVLLLTFAQNGRIHPVLKDEAESSIKNIHFESVESWLEPGGNMASKETFQTWIKSGDFQTWYKENAQQDYSGETDLSKMTIAEVQSLVEMVFPMTKGMRTIYSDVNSGDQRLSEQMATLLKDGKLPEAKYALDSNPVAPRD